MKRGAKQQVHLASLSYRFSDVWVAFLPFFNEARFEHQHLHAKAVNVVRHRLSLRSEDIKVANLPRFSLVHLFSPISQPVYVGILCDDAIMPTYHIHDTAVKLYVWDPHQSSSNVEIEQSGSAPLDPACGRNVELLKEEYFQGQEGVDFLGCDMPFYLVNAGRDLFFNTYQASNVAIDVSLVDHSHDAHAPTEVEEDDDDSALSTISSSIFVDMLPSETVQAINGGLICPF